MFKYVDPYKHSRKSDLILKSDEKNLFLILKEGLIGFGDRLDMDRKIQDRE